MMSSLYIGSTGLKSHAEGMSVITHNLSNVNTVGYKQMAMQYSDLISQYVTASSANMTNCNQKGMGSVPSSNRTLFIQGGFESGSEATDLSINGLGFFGVTKKGQTQYTRAGNFRFTKTGELLDPSGWNLMGRAIVNGVESGASSPIALDLTEQGLGYMAPKASTWASLGSQLGGVEDKSSDAANPFFTMTARWDGTLSTPLGKEAAGFVDAIQFYDSNGDLRSANVYYDRVGTSGGFTTMEYLVAMDPSMDASALADTKAAGLLLAGTITFASNGEMANLTAFTPPSSGDPADLAGWTPAALSNGQPVVNVQATGANPQSITLDMGFTFPAGAGNAGGGLGSAAEAAGNADAMYVNLQGKTLSPNASTMYGSSPGANYASRDGYAPGYLRSMQVTADGILRGQYSNSQDEDLYRITVYRFTSQDGLRHEGDNHYSATPDSGPAEEGIPGEENFGTLAEYTLEQSNVDYAREFSLLIVTQRGFQMNSKIITTSDQMLQKALELKR